MFPYVEVVAFQHHCWSSWLPTFPTCNICRNFYRLWGIKRALFVGTSCSLWFVLMIHIKWQKLLPYPANMSKKPQQLHPAYGFEQSTHSRFSFIIRPWLAMAKTAKRRLLQAFRLKRTSPSALPIFTNPPASFPTYPSWQFPICGLASSCLHSLHHPPPIPMANLRHPAMCAFV